MVPSPPPRPSGDAEEEHEKEEAEDQEEEETEDAEGEEDEEAGEGDEEGEGAEPVPEVAEEPPPGTMPAGASRRRGDVDTGGYVRVRLPDKKRGEMFGIADMLQGGSRMKVNCEDGRSRMGRIPGKLKRRMWMREGDLVIVRPWDFQNDKCDVVFRYTKTQAAYLSRKGMVPKTIDIF